MSSGWLLRCKDLAAEKLPVIAGRGTALCTAMPTFLKGSGVDVHQRASALELASRKGFERERAFPGATIITPNGQRESGSHTAFGRVIPRFLHSPGPRARIKLYGLTDTSNISLSLSCAVVFPPSSGASIAGHMYMRACVCHYA